MKTVTVLKAFSDWEGKNTYNLAAFEHRAHAKEVHMAGVSNALMCAPREQDVRHLCYTMCVYESVEDFVEHNIDSILANEYASNVLRGYLSEHTSALLKSATDKLTDVELRALKAAIKNNYV